MTNPAESSPAGPLADLGIDLGALINDPNQSINLTSDSLSGGLSMDGGLKIGGEVNVSLSAPGGIPQVSVDGSAQFAATGEADAYGSYDHVDVTTDADAGTMDVSIDSVDGEASVYGGVEAGIEFGLDASINPLDGSPDVGVSSGFEFGTESGFDVDGGYNGIDLHTDNGSGGDFM